MSNDQSKEFTFGEIAMGLLLDTGPAQEEMQMENNERNGSKEGGISLVC